MFTVHSDGPVYVHIYATRGQPVPIVVPAGSVVHLHLEAKATLSRPPRTQTRVTPPTRHGHSHACHAFSRSAAIARGEVPIRESCYTTASSAIDAPLRAPRHMPKPIPQRAEEFAQLDAEIDDYFARRGSNCGPGE